MMAQNISPSENKEKHDDQQLRVVILGFESADEERLIRTFQCDRTEGRRYFPSKSLEEKSNGIVIVNYDNPLALREKDAILEAYPQSQVMAVSRGPLKEAPAHHLRGMLIAARVFSVLDKVPVEPSCGDTLAPQPIIAGTPLQVVAIKPLASTPTAPIEKPVAPVISTSPNNAGFRALVVDDSLAIQKSLELNLATLPQIQGIDFANNGEIAIEKAEAQQYDLIFLDIMMPGIDGYETCGLLRKKPEYKKTPIIMVSGKNSPLDEVKGVVAGCTTYLTKPIQPEAFQKLGTRLISWLEKQKKP
ncbi:MAG: response regulator [Methylovulum sp.]|uniref:response regulator n=1 Tax=Methylovulum sp. TaxID=1916980 RepID=UPI002630C239|nr:response regulator [Methylovulum sp.]MDD2723169.1 response regulator [Methylovulum sp.]MDD5124651.1 response regulator [Methylovulum sp.]